MIREGIAFLALAERRYPQKLAFLYLNDVSESFVEELKNTYGSSSGMDYQSKIETIDNSYAFLKFGKAQLPLFLYIFLNLSILLNNPL